MDRREMIVIRMAVGTIAVGCGLLIASLILPPPGEIDSSVLVAFGEISTFSGALVGIKRVRSEKRGRKE